MGQDPAALWLCYMLMPPQTGAMLLQYLAWPAQQCFCQQPQQVCLGTLHKGIGGHPMAVRPQGGCSVMPCLS